MTTRFSRHDGHAVTALWLMAAVYLFGGLAAMWLFSPRVPYADGWRFLAHFLETPFPQDILTPDNGHREVLPNAVRVFELQVFSAQQWFQTAVGMVLALATLAVAARTLLREGPATPTVAAAILFVTAGVFWLGNVRALGHGNESVHAYFVTLFLVVGLALLSRPPPSAGRELRDVAVAAVCGIAATFSFGSGIACFVAYAVVLAIRGVRWPSWALMGGGLLIALLPAWLGSGAQVPFQIALLAQAEHLPRWLAAPFVYALWPLLDPAIAMQIPLGAARVPAHAIAQSTEATFGPVMLARWPHMLIGVIGLTWLGMETWRAWRRPLPGVLLGVGIAWFAVAVGGMVVLTRLEYLQVHPDQLLAPRYVVWSSLFWAGLAIAATLHVRRPMRAGVLALVTAIMLLPSQAWMGMQGWLTRGVAEHAALAATTGVVDTGLALGETVPGDLAAALPALRATRSSMFAWPEARWLGQTLQPDDVRVVDASHITVTTVDNRLGEPGRRVRFTLGSVPGPRLLLVDEDDVVRGLALREFAIGRQGRSKQWTGWMVDDERQATPRVAVPLHEHNPSR